MEYSNEVNSAGLSNELENRKCRVRIAQKSRSANGPELVEAVRLPFQHKSETRLIPPFPFVHPPLSSPILSSYSSFRRRKPEARVHAFAISATFYEQLLFHSIHPLLL